MDCHMPIMDGFAATMKIVEACREAGCKLPHIVALTASHPSSDLNLQCQQSGMQELMMKPASVQMLTALFKKQEII